MSTYTNLKLKAENVALNSRHSYLSAHIMHQELLKLYWKSPQKSILKFVEALNP